jgi:hypothetical protein
MNFINKLLTKIWLARKIIIEFGWKEYDEKLVFWNDVIFDAYESYLRNYMVDLANNRKFTDIDSMKNFWWQLLADKDTFKELYKEESKKPIEEQMEKIQWKMLEV